MKKPKLLMLKYFKVGMKVWVLDSNNETHAGEVVSIFDTHPATFPIEVKFENGGTCTYTFDGRENTSSQVTVFQHRPTIVANKPLFDEKPAYFLQPPNRWYYDTLSDISTSNEGWAKDLKCWFSTWQLDPPKL